MTKEETIELYNNIENKPKLLLHACCGPCISGVIPQLKDYFDITLLYYNPNTYPKEEYLKRAEMIKELNKHMDYKYIICEYDDNEFFSKIKGLENEKEGGKRCEVCYRLRLEETAKYAKEHNFQYFTSTLSVSPYKNASKLNDIGNELENIYDVKYLYSDFKKKDGYKNSIKISKELGLYRQEYCGCIYSMNEGDKINEK